MDTFFWESFNCIIFSKKEGKRVLQQYSVHALLPIPLIFLFLSWIGAGITTATLLDQFLDLFVIVKQGI